MTKCPKCGAGHKFSATGWFDCGSRRPDGSNQTTHCKDRQIAALTKKLEHCEKLLEAWTAFDTASKEWTYAKDPSPELNDKLQASHNRLKELGLI